MGFQCGRCRSRLVLLIVLSLCLSMKAECSEGATAPKRTDPLFGAMNEIPVSGDVVYYRKNVPAYVTSGDAPFLALSMSSFPRVLLEGKGLVSDVVVRIPDSVDSFPYKISLKCG